eukprot:378060-Hanusia_phi.AAC.1
MPGQDRSRTRYRTVVLQAECRMGRVAPRPAIRVTVDDRDSDPAYSEPGTAAWYRRGRYHGTGPGRAQLAGHGLRR